MTMVSANEMIDFLVKRKFPLPENKLLALVYKNELKVLPGDELFALYKQIQAKYLEEIQAKDEQQEQQRFFNQPHAKADFLHWSKATYWTLDEAIALVFGKAPEKVTWEYIKPSRNVSQFAHKYSRVHDLALRAKNWGQLYDPIQPGLFLAWAKRNDINIPQELLEQVAARGIVIADWKDMYDKLKEQYDSLKTRYDSVGDKPDHVSNKESPLTQSDYWRSLESLTKQAISEYPAWCKTQRKVQKSGNLQEWLTQVINADNREAEILKKVLSDFFQELK